MDKRKNIVNKITLNGVKCIEAADRSITLDCLKAVSIIAVVLCYMGCSYLVEVCTAMWDICQRRFSVPRKR